MQCLHKYLVYISPCGHVIKDDTLFLRELAVNKRQWICARMLCTIYWVAGGLITIRNRCHSCQLWNKMIKLCPTFNPAPPPCPCPPPPLLHPIKKKKTTYESLIIPWPSPPQPFLSQPPSLSIQLSVFPQIKLFFLLCPCSVFIAQENRQRIKIKQPREYQMEYIHVAVWVLSVAD